LNVHVQEQLNAKVAKGTKGT